MLTRFALIYIIIVINYFVNKPITSMEVIKYLNLLAIISWLNKVN